MIFLTADPHGDYTYIAEFCRVINSSLSDTMIILGDTCLNYELNQLDELKKSRLAILPITFLCVHGNEELRAEHISSYIQMKRFSGKVYFEQKYPNILFAKDAEIYKIEKYSFLTIGGAYSATRLLGANKGYKYWDDEQPSDFTKERINNYCARKMYIDFVLTHTCPFNFVPPETFTLPIDHSLVDRSTEKWMQKVYDSLSFNRWFCGHYHTNKTVEKMTFIYKTILSLCD